MDFLCYLHGGWDPLVRPAESTRPWMDATPESFAYRCLPLNIANAHGWEILSPCDAEALWTGQTGAEGVIVRNAPGTAKHNQAVSLFGQGTVTFHIQALFRTPPGWDLFITGSPNRPKDGIMPLSGVVETDWSPYSFTMNWKFTRRNHRVRFQRGEPICFVFPVQRGALERMDPKVVDLEDNPALYEDFKAWSRSRDEFQANVGQARSPTERWQKRYYRGVGMADEKPVADHRTRLRLKPFAAGEPSPPVPSMTFDEAGLERIVGAAVAAGREGATAAELSVALVGAGVPGGMAARLAAAACGAETVGEGKMG
jgi:Family of unknown function (DUF6065)